MSYANDADQILPRLWLGNFASSQDINFIKNNRITVIVNCTKDLPFLPINGVYKYRIPVDDNLQPEEFISMAHGITHILPILEDHAYHGRSILVHCAAGMQRSAIVVLSFLYGCRGFPPKSAYYRIKQRRPIAFSPQMNFVFSFRRCFGDQALRQLVM